MSETTLSADAAALLSRLSPTASIRVARRSAALHELSTASLVGVYGCGSFREVAVTSKPGTPSADAQADSDARTLGYSDAADAAAKGGAWWDDELRQNDGDDEMDAGDWS